MAKQSAREFFDTIKADAGIIVQFERAAVAAALSALAVRLGRDRGFAFTDSDVESLIVEAAGSSRSLSDDELANVAGGVGLAPPNIARNLSIGCTTFNCLPSARDRPQTISTCGGGS